MQETCRVPLEERNLYCKLGCPSLRISSLIPFSIICVCLKVPEDDSYLDEYLRVLGI